MYLDGRAFCCERLNMCMYIADLELSNLSGWGWVWILTLIVDLHQPTIKDNCMVSHRFPGVVQTLKNRRYSYSYFPFNVTLLVYML